MSEVDIFLIGHKLIFVSVIFNTTPLTMILKTDGAKTKLNSVYSGILYYSVAKQMELLSVCTDIYTIE